MATKKYERQNAFLKQRSVFVTKPDLWYEAIRRIGGENREHPCDVRKDMRIIARG